LKEKLHCDKYRPIAAEGLHFGRREIVAKHVTVLCASKYPNPKSTRGRIMTENRILFSIEDLRSAYLQVIQCTVLIL
jgi:hypothetical protein